MKKLSIVSNQIKNNTYSYTGKGAFEAVALQQKEHILKWLEELVPIQKQIEQLYDLTHLQFQKRNYTRILTKLFPQEYTEFVSINILVRDSSMIAQYYETEFNLTLLYEKLIKEQYLKYPGKNKKFVQFDLFQKFVMMYRDELVSSRLHQKHTTQPTHEAIVDTASSSDKLTNTIPTQNIDEELEQENITTIQEIDKQKEQKEKEEQNQKEQEEEKKQKKEKDTNWTQLLLGKLR
jgi:hypothetical protein